MQILSWEHALCLCLYLHRARIITEGVSILYGTYKACSKSGGVIKTRLICPFNLITVKISRQPGLREDRPGFCQDVLIAIAAGDMR